jgi:small multidrug resistance family-3 protein
MTNNHDSATNDAEKTYPWTASSIVLAIFLFCLAGLAEIIGGWMVWRAVRGNDNSKKPWWYAVVGSFILILYGFIPTLQPTDSFGRIYAVYGGFFIVLSFLIGWWLDGDKPDRGDLIGGAIALVGVLLILFWPRDAEE